MVSPQCVSTQSYFFKLNISFGTGQVRPMIVKRFLLVQVVFSVRILYAGVHISQSKKKKSKNLFLLKT